MVKQVKKNKISSFSLHDKLVALLAFTGVAISLYLAYIKLFNTKSFCTFSETLSCDAVNASIYSDIFGIPISFLGIGYFTLVLLLVLFKRSVNSYRFIFFLTIFVLMPSYYLTGVEIFILEAYCILCEISKILMIVILVLSFFQTNFLFKKALRMSIPVVIAGVVAAGITFLAQSGGGTKDDYTPFVDNLNKKGVIMYKSFKCANCKRQEKLLGKAYKQLNQVECHPEGPDQEADRCLKMGINKTPTFLIEKDGQELKRLEGLQKLEKLGEWAEVKLEKANQ